eukprot:TRINITY_DN14841_c0_g1_i1.p1 TRINITY_DN14841_c0_g1~~TRINITY_DN14841_c0_g1_i1.p1  ORF type:complete len:113 (-),score=48.80 TRINITY_DN14841_c0_g1_i1:109-447(-)
MRLQKEIDAKKRAQGFTFAPQLVSLLDDALSPEDLDYLFNLRALPETVVVLKHKLPKAVNIDATEEDEIAEEEGDDDSVDEEDEDCLLYTSDAADEEDSVDLGGRRIIKKKK